MVAGLGCCGWDFCCAAGLETVFASVADERGAAAFWEAFFALGGVDGLGGCAGFCVAGRACCEGLPVSCREGFAAGLGEAPRAESSFEAAWDGGVLKVAPRRGR